MAYCPRCGNKNEEDAAFCKNCGAPMHGAPDKYDRQRDRDQRCEEDCGGGPAGHGWRIFWGVIIILIGLAIFFEVVLKELAKTYPDLSWVNSFQWGWIFGGVVALVIILVGVRVITRRH
jgi:uncharacterized membrane protein YvbJ